MATYKWTFTDPVSGGLGTYTFNVNPNTYQVQYQKTMTIESSVIPGSPPLFYEGQDQPPSFQFSGIILAQSQHQTFVTWYKLRRQLLLLTDTGWSAWIYVYNYQFTRKRSALFPWRGDWQMQAYVLSEVFP